MWDVFTYAGWWQWIGCISGLIYIFTAACKWNHCWIYGFVSAIAIAVVDYSVTHLYMDALLHILYAALAILGLFLWNKPGSEKNVMKVSRMSKQNYLGYLLLSGLIAGAAGYLLQTQTDACYPYIDAFVSTLSVFATFLVIYRILDVWSYWLAVNLASIYLYWQTGAPLFSVLYIAYFISNLLKWRYWRKEWNRRNL